MSATVCVYQRKDRVNKDNTAPIFIRITVDRKKKLLATGISVPIDAWLLSVLGCNRIGGIPAPTAPR